MFSLSHNYFQVNPSSAKHEAAAAASRPSHSPVTSGKKYAFGILVLLLVDVLWVTSAEISKFIYNEKKYEKPFFTAYIRASLLSVYLLALCVTTPVKTLSPNIDYTQLLDQVAETEDENFYSEANENLGDSTFVPVRAAGETTDSDDAAPRAVRFNKVAEVRVMSAAQAGEALLARLSWQASRRAFEQAQRRAAASAARSHLKLAFTACIPWFMAHYLYRLSLAHGPASSATMYASCYSALALGLGAAVSRASDQRLTAAKVCAGALIMLGVVILGVWESHQSHRLMSALAATGAGVCYTVHLLILRNELKKGDSTKSPVFLGLVGGLCVLLAWPLGGALHAVSWEHFEWPTTAQWTWLLLDGSLGLVLSEPLWLWGRSLTSSRTATALLALCAPLSLLAEGCRGQGSAAGWTAALLIGAGWAAGSLLAGAGPEVDSAVRWIADKCWPAGDRLSTLRYIPDIDEQSESLIAFEETN